MEKEEIVLDEYISHIANEINNEKLKEKILKEDFNGFCFIQVDKIKKKGIGYCFEEFIEIGKERNLKEDLNLSFYKSCDFIIFKNNKTKVIFVEVSDILSTLKEIILKNRDILQEDKRKFQSLVKEKLNEEFRAKIKDSLALLFYLLSLQIFLKNKEIKIDAKGNYFVIADYYGKDRKVFLFLGRLGLDERKLKKEIKEVMKKLDKYFTELNNEEKIILFKTYLIDFKNNFVKGFNGRLNEFLDLVYINLHKTNIKETLEEIFDK